MATLLFDFDSTLIDTESLDEILRKKLSSEELEKSQVIMKEALVGIRDFGETLKERLSLAPLHRKDFEEYGKKALDHLSEGIEDFLRTFNGQVWIVSGSLLETLYPVADKLCIPRDRVIGVKALWDEDGLFLGIDSFVSKWQSAKEHASEWTHPVVAIGDALTDFELYTHGLADKFIAYTAHVSRSQLLAVVDHQIKSFHDLSSLL